MKKVHSIIAILLFTLMSGCVRPDQVGNAEFCQSGRNILTLSGLNNAQITTETRNMIYGTSPSGQPGSWYNTTAKLRTRKLVIIPFVYSNVLPNTMVTTATIRNAFFSTGTGSVKDYFLANSWGSFNLTEAAIEGNWVQLQQPQSYYAGFSGGDPTLTPQLYADVCDKSNINWGAIDTNNDQNISPDEAIICLLSPEGGIGMTMRAMSISFNSNNGGGVYFASGNMNVFLCKTQATQTGTDDISYGKSTICHELCHSMFDLPDRYFSNCGSGWTGRWDIMSNNCAFVNMNIVDKIKLGWISPPIITAGSSEVCYNFPTSNANPAALIIWDNKVPNQYFVVENRHRASSPYGFDAGIGEDGLAIWCVNEAVSDSKVRVSLVDGRTANTGTTISPNYGIGNSYYVGSELGVLFSSATNNNFICTAGDNCPITFIRYGGTAIEQGNLIHGIRAVGLPSANMYAAIY